MPPKNNKETMHIVMDWKSGVLYNFRLDDEEKCTGFEFLSTAPAIQKPGQQVTQLEDYPWGKTLYGIDPTGSAGSYTLYTVVWPDKGDMDAAGKQKMPAVAVKSFSGDLVKAGIAAWPKALKDPGVVAQENEEELKKALSKINDLIGLSNVKKDLAQHISMVRFMQAKKDLGLSTDSISLHAVFTGNPGTGKTTVAREYAKVLHALGLIKKPDVREVSRRDLVAGYVGQTAIKTREEIDKAKGGVLFIDEAYALTMGDGSKDFGKEAIAELVAAMENERESLVVIVAGYTEPMKKFIESNEGLKSRFLNYIEFQDYSLNELSQILDYQAKIKGYTMTADAREVAVEKIKQQMSESKKHFGNGRTVRNLVEKAEKVLAHRLDGEGWLKKGGKGKDLPKDELKKLVTTITKADMDQVDMAGIATKAEKKIGLTLPEVETKAPANNDNKPALTQDIPAFRPQLRRPGFN